MTVTIQDADTWDHPALRKALGHFATGIAVITAPGLDAGDEPVGVTVNSFTGISLDPPLVLFSVSRSLRSLAALMAARHFGINLLGCGQQEISTRFAKAQTRKWDGIEMIAGQRLDCSLIPGAIGHFECLPHATFEGGDHIIFLVRVVRFAIDDHCAPLVFFRSAYHRLEQTLDSPLHARGHTMSIRNGKAHLHSLRDGREIWLDGHRVADVTTAPAFRNAVASAAALYDFQARPENQEVMTFETPGGRRVNRAWQMPASYQELVGRRRAMEDWAQTHHGFMGRSPDHVASCLAGMVMGADLFEQYDPKRAAALRDYYEYARDADLFLTYAIVNPQADRSKAAHEQADPFLALGVVDEDSTGITVRGAKMLATSAIMANEILVSCIQPLSEDDKRHAVTFCVPLATKGLKILSRKSYEAQSSSEFDNPLGHRFDENDAVIFFDDVKVSMDRVFVNQDVGMSARQWHATPAHVLQNYQCQVRLAVKLRFLMGIARKTAEVNGTLAFPGVREQLGQLAADTAMVEAMVYGMEAKGRMEKGYFIPDRHFLYSAQVITQQLYGKIINGLRELAGGGVIMLPSSAADFDNPMLHEIIGKTQKSPTVSPDERVKFFKLAWDAIGSEFASRHCQYEMFYAGAPFVPRGHSFRTYDWAGATAQVDSLLDSYSLPAPAPRLAQV